MSVKLLTNRFRSTKNFSVKLKIFPSPTNFNIRFGCSKEPSRDGSLGAQKNRLIEMVPLSTHNMFWLRNKKIKFLLCTLN